MRKHAGQAVRGVLLLTRRLLSLALALVVLALGVAVALSWRFASGPIEVPWLVRRLEAALNTDPAQPRWTIGSAVLAWEGFTNGLDRPIDIRVADIAALTPDGRVVARLPEARVSLSARELLLHQRVLPRAMELHGAELHAHRDRAGGVTLDIAAHPAAPGAAPDAAPSGAALDAAPGVTVDALLLELLQPIQSGQPGLLSQLRRVVVRDARLVLVDEGTATNWTAHNINVDIRRADVGGATADAVINTTLGSQELHLVLTAALRDVGSAGAEANKVGDFLAVTLNADPLNLARLAVDLPIFAALAPLDATLGVEGTLAFDRALGFRRGDANIRIGPGRIAAGRGALAVKAASVIVRGDATAVSLTDLRLDLPTPGGAVVRVIGAGSIALAPDGYDMELAVTLESMAAANLGAIWPQGVAGAGTRDWITGNITAGVLHDLHAALGLHASADFSELRLTRASGSVLGDGVTLHWLKPVPPIEQGQVEMTIVSPDMLEFNILAGRRGGLRLSNGLVRIYGLAGPDQAADIAVDIAGPLAEVLGVLRHPRLRLFDRHPIEMRDPAGEARGRLEIPALPLVSWLAVEDVHIRSTARLENVHLGAIAGGRDLDQGMLDLAASNDALKVTGTAVVAGIASKLAVDMDFRPGPATQIVQTVTVAATTTPAQVAALGLDLGGFVQGAVPGTLVWRTRRDTSGDLALSVDLGPAKLALDGLSYAKAAGRPAKAELHALLVKDAVTAIDKLTLQGEGIDGDARLRFASGRLAQIVVNRLRLGTETDVRADITPPVREGAPWQVKLTGASLDGSAQLRHTPQDARPGPPYVLDARLDRVSMGKGGRLFQVVLRIDNDGRINRTLHLTGRAPAEVRPGGGGAEGGFVIDIAPAPGGRALNGSSSDAGGLLRVLDVVSSMAGGAMTITGRYDDSRADHLLTGNVTITDFRMSRAPGLAKLLQAMTFYGLVELLGGPGLGFARLEAPFTMAGDVLEMDNARAFNASLGMTAKGRVNLATDRCDFTGTIVPAYFFNSLLGNIPLVGRLFSAETGGGLLAASYGVSGACVDPAITVNPLSALTPGFLRGIFGIFDGAGSPQPPTPTPIR